MMLNEQILVSESREKKVYWKMFRKESDISFQSKIMQLILVVIVSSTAQFKGRIDCGIIENSEIKEASGIAASKVYEDVLYVHNDSGDKSRIFVINKKGKSICEYHLLNCQARDWEDIATGVGPLDSCNYIYIGDIGDNKAKYDIKYVYRFPEPDLSSINSQKNIVVQNFDVIRFRYSDGKFDAEALMVDPLTKDIFIISKRDLKVRVYQIRYPQLLNKVITIKCIDTLDVSMVVAADISPSGTEIIMKNYHEIYYWRRNPGESVRNAFSRMPKKLSYVKERQGEALSWDKQADGYFTLSEQINGHLYYYPRISK